MLSRKNHQVLLDWLIKFFFIEVVVSLSTLIPINIWMPKNENR